ncbi:hypothetical protein NUK49_20220 [Aeromonas caviae]|uniref:hypothetical protein n=1 Tax=Aeromonas caviae TaxID=648 RepID=UPI00214E7B69|nr:hypothetical protein [Aeromonas caviae]MCR3985834.1 hypothetical protein [Aeromonas caviae]
MSKIKPQELFYIFLQEKQKTKTRFTKDDVIKATGWKPSTFKAYMGKGQITKEGANKSYGTRAFNGNPLILND